MALFINEIVGINNWRNSSQQNKLLIPQLWIENNHGKKIAKLQNEEKRGSNEIKNIKVKLKG